MKYFVLLSVLLFLSPPAFAAGYPNELDGFKLYARHCRSLEPMKSTLADVRKELGKPVADNSDNHVLWYEKDGWQILISVYPDNGEYPSWLAGKVVESIDFIPIKPVSFNAISLPKAFNRVHVRAADASWDEYYDAFGLVYEVYTSQPPHGEHGPGDLNRISYRPAPHKVIEMQSWLLRELKDKLQAPPSKARGR